MATIAIDLGATYSSVCVYENNVPKLIPNSLGKYITPTVVSILESENIVVGEGAKLNTNTSKLASNFIQYLGTQTRISVDDKSYTAVKMTSFLLRSLKNDAEKYLNTPVTEAVITVPTHFNDHQRHAIKFAGELAGLYVSKLINAPSAITLNYITQKNISEGTFLIVDFGGNSLGVSITSYFNGIIEVISSNSNTRIGGQYIDKIIAEYFCENNGVDFDKLSYSEQIILLQKAEIIKKILSKSPYAFLECEINEKTYNLNLSETILEQLCNKLFEKCIALIRKTITESFIAMSEINDIILVGGISKLNIFRNYLDNNLKIHHTLFNPDTAEVFGAGHFLGNSQITITDICPFSLGVATYINQIDKIPTMTTIIPKNHILPVSKCSTFYTLEDNQTDIKIEIFKGENYLLEKNEKLDEIIINVPPNKAGKEFVKVYFSYDINGVLKVDTLSSDGDKKSLIIADKSLYFSKARLNMEINKLDKVKFAYLQEQDFITNLIKQADEIYAEAGGDNKIEISRALEFFLTQMQTNSEVKKRRLLNWFFNFIEDMKTNIEDKWNGFII
ncbi:MAG: hypothetical protein ATN36_01225 [Epulopiscium sp. Nele67-Bin005]|nr:MAG: hypothetical protein ATN36_01225 [Epulopiscium sp. Nele67-Bin005]